MSLYVFLLVESKLILVVAACGVSEWREFPGADDVFQPLCDVTSTMRGEFSKVLEQCAYKGIVIRDTDLEPGQLPASAGDVSFTLEALCLEILVNLVYVDAWHSGAVAVAGSLATC